MWQSLFGNCFPQYRKIAFLSISTETILTIFGRLHILLNPFSEVRHSVKLRILGLIPKNSISVSAQLCCF